MLEVCSEILIPRVHVILDNDLCGSSVMPEVIRSDVPNIRQEAWRYDEKDDKTTLSCFLDDPAEDDQIEVYPACFVTRAQSAQLTDVEEKTDVFSDVSDVSPSDEEELDLGLRDLFEEHTPQITEIVEVRPLLLSYLKVSKHDFLAGQKILVRFAGQRRKGRKRVHSVTHVLIPRWWVIDG